MFLRLRRVALLLRTTLLTMSMMTQIVYSKPQEPDVFENVASQAIAVAGNMAEMVGDAGMFSNKMGMEIPFGSANSETQVGTGAAMRNDEDDSSEEDRRKRSADLQAIDDYLIGEEALLAFSPEHRHLHRGKRSPCHNGGAGTGGGGTGDEDLDIAERRRRAYARKLKAAASRKKATSGKKTTGNSSRKKLVSEDDYQTQGLARRKRQTELDDLDQNTANASKDYVQQIGEKLQNIWQSVTGAMTEMAQKLKQHFSGQDSANTTEI